MPERAPNAAFSTWLSEMDPLAVYALAVGTVMAVLAFGLWLASYRADRRALRLFSVRYAAAAPAWIFGHPQAHGAQDAAPFVPMVIAVVLLALTAWALDEFLGTTNRRRLAAIAALGLAAIALLAVLQRAQPDSALGIYTVMASAMAACAAMAWRRRDVSAMSGTSTWPAPSRCTRCCLSWCCHSRAFALRWTWAT